jgi:hypothetical protein
MAHDAVLVERAATGEPYYAQLYLIKPTQA